jgi:threonine/homoserine efflux transporter RhtA
MRTPRSIRRWIAVVLVIVLAVTLSAPAPAHADVLGAIGIATAAVAGALIIGYLIVANASERRWGRGDIVSIGGQASREAVEAP